MGWLGQAMVKHYQGDDADVKLLLGAVASAFAERATARQVGVRFPRTVRPYSAALHRRIVMRRTGCGCSSFKPYIYQGGGAPS